VLLIPFFLGTFKFGLTFPKGGRDGKKTMGFSGGPGGKCRLESWKVRVLGFPRFVGGDWPYLFFVGFLLPKNPAAAPGEKVQKKTGWGRALILKKTPVLPRGGGKSPIFFLQYVFGARVGFGGPTVFDRFFYPPPRLGWAKTTKKGGSGGG